MLKPYEKLSVFYQAEWGNFSLKYIKIIDAIVQKTKIKPHSILDISCGTGNLIGNLAKNYEVVGSDISPSMIEKSKEKYPQIEFHISDMAKLNLNRKFDIVLSTFDSINYLLDLNHLHLALQNICRLTRKNGLFIFDINTPILCQKKHKGIIERNINGFTFKQILNYEENNKIATTIFDFGNGEIETHLQKAYTYDEVSKCLIENNFKILQTMDLFTNEDITENSEKVLIIVQKGV